MPEDAERASKTQLAIALAQRDSIRGLARAHDLPRVTARPWSHKLEVSAEIEAFRDRAVDREVGEGIGWKTVANFPILTRFDPF